MRRPRPQVESDATLKRVRVNHYREMEKAGIAPGFFSDVSNCHAASLLGVADTVGVNDLRIRHDRHGHHHRIHRLHPGGERVLALRSP